MAKVFIFIFKQLTCSILPIGRCLTDRNNPKLQFLKKITNLSQLSLQLNLIVMHIFHKRQGQMDFYNSYFYTDTICHFAHLLADDNLKLIVINSLQFLVKQQLVEIYGYVIMPNHIHLLWNMLKMNGNESPATSFTKFTAHQFRKHLLTNNPIQLEEYKSEKMDRNYQFWKRDPLAIPLSTEDILIQKLDYMHNNPIKEKWNLCQQAEQYKWSSANFYLTGFDEFGMLKNFRE